MRHLALAALIGLVAGSAGAVTTSKNVDITVTPSGPPGACDQNLARAISNPTTSDLGTQVVLYEAAVPCALASGGAGAQYQVLSTKELAFQTNLPAGQTKSIAINDVLNNRYPIAAPLTYTSDANTQTVGNEYFTVVLNKTQNLSSAKAAVSSIAPKSGSLTLTGNPLPPLVCGSTPHEPLCGISLTGYTFEILEQGPLVARFRMTYQFSSTDYTVGSLHVWPANASNYASEIVELRAGVPDVFFEEESQFDWKQSLNINNITATEMIYRGHHAQNIPLGYTFNQDGSLKQYGRCCGNNWGDNPYADGFRDIIGGQSPGPLVYNESTHNPRLNPHDDFVTNGGEFEILYDRNNPSTNWLGIFAGYASRGMGVMGQGDGSGVVYDTTTSPATIVYYAAGANSSSDLSVNRGGKVRYPWALTMGTGQPGSAIRWDVYTGQCDPTGNAIPCPFNNTPAVSLEQNHEIFLPLTKMLQWTPDSPNETFSSATGQLTSSQQTALFNRLKTDSAFLTYMCNADSKGCNTYNYIANPTPSASLALYNQTVNTQHLILDQLWNLNGIYDSSQGLRGAEAVANVLPNIQFMASDPNLTTTQKNQFYQSQLFLSALLTDCDYMPLCAPANWNFGTPNMPLDFNAGRAEGLLSLQNNSYIKNAAPLATELPSIINYEFSAEVEAGYGDLISTPLYSRTFVSGIDLCQQAQVAGSYDCTVSQPDFPKVAQFTLDILTPPEVRFGTQRKQVSLDGDSPTSSAEWQGQLGAMFEASNPTLSGQLMAAWDAMGNQLGSFYGLGGLKVDQNAPRGTLIIGDHYYPGYMSVMRSGFATADESALWFLHGNHFVDHRGSSAGQTDFYLLGAPVSVSPSCYFNCSANGRYGGTLLASGLVLASDAIAQGWDGTASTLPCCPGILNNQDVLYQTGLMATDSSTSSLTGSAPSTTATYGAGLWTRKVQLNRAQTATPVVVIEDSYPGGNTAQKIVSQSFMATGAVSTPLGNITPSIPPCPDMSFPGSCRGTPTNEGFHNLSQGWNQFGFTGQYGGVDWIFMVYASDTSSRFQLGAWLENWQEAYEWFQYQAQNGGQNYQELTYQFRLWSGSASKFVVIPYRHGASVPTISTNGAVSITVNGNVVLL